MTKTVYNYDPLTGAFISEALADESPLEPGVFMVPANATELKPSSQKDIWCAGKWTVAFVPVIDPVAALAAAKKAAFLTIDQFHAATVQKLVGNPTQVEKDTWSLKLEVASAITNKTSVSAAGQAFLAGAGMTTDAAKAAWAASVLAKSAAYAQVVGLAEKLRNTARTVVKTATDKASLKAAVDEQRAAAAADAAVDSLLSPL